tara:strand:- start:658 stop:1080 length:423 start_codon:yes stop_codon:yes gene_type:complete
MLLVACDSFAPKETFQDCVLTKVSGAANQSVANILREACAKKHQVQLPQSALAKLETKAGQAVFGFVIHIDNRNPDWLLTEVEFYIERTPGSIRKPYIEKIYIEPLSKEAFFPRTGDEPKQGDTEFSWGVLRAWGVPVKR